MGAPASPQVTSGPQQRRSYSGVPSFQGQPSSKFTSAPNTPRHSQGDLTDSRSSSPVANSRRRLSGLRAPSLATPTKPAPPTSKLGGPRPVGASSLQPPRIATTTPRRSGAQPSIGGGGGGGGGAQQRTSGVTAGVGSPLTTFSAHRQPAPPIPTSVNVKSRLPNPHKGFGYNQNN